MKSRWMMILTLVLGCLAGGGSAGIANDGVKPASTEVRVSQEQPAPSYSQRAQAAVDLQEFQGGRQVIVATEYDVHILVGVLVVAAIVLLILLL